MKKVLILNYHLLTTRESQPEDHKERLYAVSFEHFKNQIDLLLRKKIPIVSLSDLVNNKIVHERSVAITFDDGNASDYNLAYPYLKKKNIPATFFVALDRVDANHISWNHLKEMNSAGFEIGSHGLRHVELTSLNDDELDVEISESKAVLEKKLDQPIEFFSFPYNQYNQKMVNMTLKHGYRAVFTTNFKINSSNSSHPIFHRWSIKQQTSMKEFERVIDLDWKIWSNKKLEYLMKKGFIRLIGNSNSIKLNIMINQLKKS